MRFLTHGGLSMWEPPTPRLDTDNRTQEPLSAYLTARSFAALALLVWNSACMSMISRVTTRMRGSICTHSWKRKVDSRSVFVG